MKTIVTVGDLKDQTNSLGPSPILVCFKCGSEFSAHAGDYFSLPSQRVLTCCKRNLRLVFKSITYTPAKL